MPVFVVGDLLLGLPGPAHLLLLFFFVFCAAPAVGFGVRRRLRIDAARRDEVLRLAAFAAEESDRAEREAVFEYYAVSAAAVAAVAAPRHQCAVCFLPTTTRCARCKAVRYWSVIFLLKVFFFLSANFLSLCGYLNIPIEISF